MERTTTTLGGSKTLGRKVAHLHVLTVSTAKLWLVICLFSRHRIQTIRSTLSCSSRMHLTGKVCLTFNLTLQSSLYSEHNDLRLYLVAVTLKVGFCQNDPSKKYAALLAPRKKKKTQNNKI